MRTIPIYEEDFVERVAAECSGPIEACPVELEYVPVQRDDNLKNGIIDLDDEFGNSSNLDG